MIPSRYKLIDERSLYPVKRRVRARREEKRSEMAVTLLPPDPYLIMERPNFFRSPSPTMYRTAPPKSAKNKEASSFVILGETISTPVQSRPASPSGRVSPFRGHGFKSPTSTRPNSRPSSTSNSPKKIPPTGKSMKPVKTSDRPRIGKDIGLPPKSPMKSKSQNLEVKPLLDSTATEEKGKETETDKTALLEGKEPEATEENKETEMADVAKPSTEKENSETAEQKPKPLQLELQNVEPPPVPKPKQKLIPVIPKDKKAPVLPGLKTSNKTQKNETNNQQSILKKPAKPPLPPKKIGLKTILKNEEGTNNQDKKNIKEATQGTPNVKENLKKKEDSSENSKPATLPKKNPKDFQEKNATENSKEVENVKAEEANKTKAEGTKFEAAKTAEVKPEESKKPETKAEEKNRNEGKKPEKLVPCFQPDKCQIAPPTMASPYPIITPTISTPSTTADLASSSIENSQSIAAAPTTVTPSSLSSVSSTVVLTGNLARKEIGSRNKSKETDSKKTDAPAAVSANKTEDSSPSEKISAQMVKAATKDSIKWNNKDSLSGEITSATKVIKAEPDMEVLSPNNLRDSPPRMPPPNLAWDEGRLPNGDVPNKVETEGKFRRFISAVWRFLSYFFCCRCFNASKCCRKASQEGAAKASILSKLNCCKGKSCRNPFKCCCAGGCKSKCCKGKKCCRRNPKMGNPKPKPRKCCAKVSCNCKGCCNKIRAQCLDVRNKINNACRSLFCLNLMCCQNFLRKFKFCHKFKCCQKDGFCSCCNPNVKREPKKLNKKGSRASNNSRDKDNLDVVLVEHTSLMKAAIPVLPSCLAIFCLMLNLFVPGFGTFVSGIFCLCFGKPRFSVKDTPKNRLGSFILNTIIGIAQLFTVVFCLVGWGWSIWWGIIMYKLSRRQKRLKLAEKNQKEAEGSNVNHNHVDVEQG